ncbi:hypothetical protein ACIQ1D_21130 [Lysinibacillus xylanilyticus]
MTLYSVLVANSSLQTVDCTGIAEITVRELKKYIQLQRVQQHSRGI